MVMDVRRRPFRRPETPDRTYRQAVADQYAETVAALYLGLVERGVPEVVAAHLTAAWMAPVGQKR